MKFFINISLFILSLIPFFNAQAQGENKNWCFGWHVGLSFNSTPPTFFTDSIVSYIGSSTVSDASGNLLFYTSGRYVWDRNHVLMPNGSDLLGNGGNSSLWGGGMNMRGVYIVKSPGNSNQYYVISGGDYVNGVGDVYYSIVDMSLNNGLGDVIVNKRNILLTTHISRGVEVATSEGNCNDYWIIFHESESNRYKAFRLNANGLDTNAVFSTGIMSTNVNNSSFIPTMKMNPAGNRIVRCSKYNGIDSVICSIEMATFNKTTGIFSSFTIINSDSLSYWQYPEWSPDGTKLYCFAKSSPVQGYYQFDLSLLPNIAAVEASKTLLSNDFSIMDSRLAPNGKIYVSNYLTDIISVINNPDNAGVACNFDANGLVIPAYIHTPINVTACVEFGNNIIINAPHDTFANSVVHFDTIVCNTPGLTLIADSTYDTYLWNSGNTDRRQPILEDGTYWVYGIKSCTIFIDTFHVHSLNNIVMHPPLDTVICLGQSITIETDTSFQSQLWNTGSLNPTEVFYAEGIYWRAATKGCETHIDSFYFHTPYFDINLGNDTTICSGQPIVLHPTLPDSISYIWQDGSLDESLVVDKEGTYSIKISKEGCLFADTISIAIVYPSVKIMENDTSICEGSIIHLQAVGVPQSSYLWSNGEGTAGIYATSDNLYVIKATNVCGTYADSVQVYGQICCEDALVPNAFTPNEDGINDIFQVHFICPKANGFLFTIYNRYGQVMFETSNHLIGWDGKYKGMPLDVGVYYYSMKYFRSNGKTEIRKGDLTLLR